MDDIPGGEWDEDREDVELLYPCGAGMYGVDDGVAYSLPTLELERSEDSVVVLVALLGGRGCDDAELGPAIARLRSAKYRSRSRNLHGIFALLQASHCVSGDDCKHLIFLRRLRIKVAYKYERLDDDEWTVYQLSQEVTRRGRFL